MMQDRRARIGVIYPADGIIDEEFWRFVIAYACASGSFVKGMGWDREIANRIERASKR